MNLTTLTAAQLRRALLLKEQIEGLEKQLTALGGGSEASLAEEDAEPTVDSAKAGPKKGATPKRGKRGAVKEAVIDLVKAAGPAGITVKEIAAALGKSYGSISVWFNSTGKKVKAINKVGRAKYAWISVSEPTAHAVTERPKAKQPGAKKSTASQPKPNQRGALKDSIVGLVKAGGKAGVSAKEVATKVSLPLPRIYNWFLSTGKKVKQIKKVGPAKYAWAG